MRKKDCQDESFCNVATAAVKPRDVSEKGHSCHFEIYLVEKEDRISHFQVGVLRQNLFTLTYIELVV